MITVAIAQEDFVDLSKSPSKAACERLVRAMSHHSLRKRQPFTVTCCDT
jgi:hypothetical protein